MVKQRGFTLIELLVAVSIIALLVSAGIVVFVRARKQANDGRRISDIRNIELALESYFEKYGHYPIPALSGSFGAATSGLGGEWILHLSSTVGSGTDRFVPEFMRAVPIDPVNNVAGGSLYYYDVNGADYRLRSRMELTNKEAERDGGNCSNLFEIFTDGGKNLGGTTCPT